MTSREELVGTYPSYLFFGFLANFCCCLKSCFERRGYLQKSTWRYEKFNLALERLAFEHDIQYILQMNRITRLIHKMMFLARQRRAIKYGHKYVISDKQLYKSQEKKTNKKKQSHH